MSQLITIITSSDPVVRNKSLDSFARDASLSTLLTETAELDFFRQQSSNLYFRVRALFFLYAIYRFHLPQKEGLELHGKIPYVGYQNLLNRRFEEAIKDFLVAQEQQGPSDALSSALAAAYHGLGFQTLADQVRRSVRSVKGNQWMFRIGHPQDHPLRIRPELMHRSNGLFPILHEATPVRMDLTHSGWSDIFFLGMDFPEGARVINTSINLSVRGHGQSRQPSPPVEAFLRIIDEPILRLASVDLGATAEISTLGELFDFARDYLGLLKAAVIAAGIVPPGMEGAGTPLSDVLAQLVGPGLGLEIVSHVNEIPKGSRLAVSTSLLASLIAVCMRATGQTDALAGALSEDERRLVAARAILGEWLGGSGGGWQDSGGAWPGMKLIRGEVAQEGDPEFGISRGRLLPSHHILTHADASPLTRQKLEDSLVLVHGGMAQDVGPILEMVTEKYLLRSEAEWAGRQEAITILDDVLALLSEGDVEAIGTATHRNFNGPIRTIIPWAGNLYTDRLIARARAAFGEDFWGFWMLGGMAGGGMGFIFHPDRRREAQTRMQTIMSETKRELENAVPFAMEPVVYDFTINEQGTVAELMAGDKALMPPGYYSAAVPALLRRDPRQLTPLRRTELDRFGRAVRKDPQLGGMVQTLFDRLLPEDTQLGDADSDLDVLLGQYGFDPVQHEQIRSDLRSGRIGLAQNQLPANSQIKDIEPGDVVDMTATDVTARYQAGLEAIASGAVAVVSLAGGAGSRWTKGAGVVKAINPFVHLDGRHRNFIEIHLAKSRRIGRIAGAPLTHIITTSYLTHAPIAEYLERESNYDYPGKLCLSPGRSVGLRLIPMTRDLRFAWEELPQQMLDEQAQKMRDSLHAALIGWAEQQGEGSDYRDNIPTQCLHPVGHWYELPNLLLNGTLAELLEQQPKLNYLMMHNIDTIGADVDPALLAFHMQQNAGLTVEVIARRLDDRGGGLARVDGHLRLVEGMALPDEKIEFDLSYYNSNTIWVTIDVLLDLFGLGREELRDKAKVASAVRRLAARMPTYITIKDVKKRWGHGQEDIYPVTQFEKLWGDMTALPELRCRYVEVPRLRGQQLKEVAQLDGWLRDGSAAYLSTICDWGERVP
ncbi:MAG: UTP--glucose-1-phosphate uridylyltransferase [Candidatus Promineifilaceae bacterium]